MDCSDDAPSPAQRRMMFALWHQHGIEDRRIRLAMTSGYIRRVIRSSTALTHREASRVIDRLQTRAHTARSTVGAASSRRSRAVN
jgi:tellurite resistance protein